MFLCINNNWYDTISRMGISRLSTKSRDWNRLEGISANEWRYSPGQHQIFSRSFAMCPYPWPPSINFSLLDFERPSVYNPPNGVWVFQTFFYPWPSTPVPSSEFRSLLSSWWAVPMSTEIIHTHKHTHTHTHIYISRNKNVIKLWGGYHRKGEKTTPVENMGWRIVDYQGNNKIETVWV